MRTTYIPSFISCLPSDLQDVLKNVNKYTDNTGNATNVEANVTATQDKVFLLAEYEVLGRSSNANQYEKNKQAQYDYYKNGNSPIMYMDTSTSQTIKWWERSPYYAVASFFCACGSDADIEYASNIIGFAPAFVVG